MPDKRSRDWVSQTTAKEAKVRAAKLGINKVRLYDLVALVPFKELESLVAKFLTKKHPSSL